LTYLLFSLYKGISADKNALVFPQNHWYCSSKMFANFGTFVAQICLTVFGVWTSFDDYLQENVYRRKPCSCTSYNTVHC